MSTFWPENGWPYAEEFLGGNFGSVDSQLKRKKMGMNLLAMGMFEWMNLREKNGRILNYFYPQSFIQKWTKLSNILI
jgi:hypothetical protein